MKILLISILTITSTLASFSQVPCFPKPEAGAVINVNVNASTTINMNCIAMLNIEDDKKTAQNSAYLSTWRINGKEVHFGDQTAFGSIRLSGNKSLVYKAPAKKPSKTEISLTAEIVVHQKKIFFWTIRIKDDAETEVHVEDQPGIMKMKPVMNNYAVAAEKNLNAYQAKLSPDAQAKLKQVKSEHPEYLNMGKYSSSAQATFIGEPAGKHFVISITDPKNPNYGLVFELPDTLVKLYTTEGEKCKAALTYGTLECKITVKAKGYVHEMTDEKGKMLEGMVTINLTELGQPGQYVKGSFIGTMTTPSKFCSETETGMHYHPIELKEVYGSFVAIRQVNIIKN